MSLKDGEERIIPAKTKFFSNKPGLKLDGGSLAEREIARATPIDQMDLHSSILKKKSHTNLHGENK